jgi:hypothetical protein
MAEFAYPAVSFAATCLTVSAKAGATVIIFDDGSTSNPSGSCSLHT